MNSLRMFRATSKLGRQCLKQNQRGISTAARASSKANRNNALRLLGAAGAGLTMVGVLNNHSETKGGLLEEINDRLIRIESYLVSYKGMLDEIEKIKKDHPNNLMAKHFDKEYFLSLESDLQARLAKIVNSGVENPDSGMGCYAMNPEDYDLFKPYLDSVIRDYHKIEGEVKHITNWDLEVVKDRLPEGGKLDLTKLGLGALSMRVRVGRNLANYPLPGAMTKQDRINMEKDMVKAFKKLIEDPQYGGTYYSLTPDTDYSISEEKYKELVKARIMFKDMAADSYLKSAGIASDWPYGRGCYVSADKQFIVWVGEEDHLRIMCMKKGTVLNEVFDRLRDACDVVEKISGKFAHSPDYGYVTSCPTNLGTGMRASVHIKVPNLTSDGTDGRAKAVCKPLGLSVRGVGGEHTPIGADGTVDISPSARLVIQEAEIICALYNGIELLLKEESKAKL